jgi:glutamate/tyrosine decarboxylase-like PLP-dependent enzyme
MKEPASLQTGFLTRASDLNTAAEIIAASYREMRDGNVAPEWSLEQTEQKIADLDYNQGLGLEGAMNEAHHLMQHGDLLSASARCFGYFNPTSAAPGVMADLLAAARNPQICLTSHGAASTTMERQVITLMLGRLGFSGGTGHFTSGGSEANETALLTALCRANPDYLEKGVFAFSGQPALYVSADSHLAWIKIAKATGIGSQAVRLVSTQGDGRIDPDALQDAINTDRVDGMVPFMIAATCGTTSAGMIDPMVDCAEIARREDLHFHVDAAWAGALIFDENRMKLLAGIETADSVTIDAHKWLSVPMGAGVVLLKDKQYAANMFSVKTSYMPDGDGEDFYITTNQWSRRFIGFRLWMMLRTFGLSGYQAMFDRHFELAEYLREKLSQNGWTIRNDGKLPVIVFDDGQSDLDSQKIADRVEERAAVWLGRVGFEGRTVLRACLTSFLTETADVDLLISELNAARNDLLKMKA